MFDLLLFLIANGRKAVKLAQETYEILFYHAAFLSFWVGLRSWLERLNMPLVFLLDDDEMDCQIYRFNSTLDIICAVDLIFAILPNDLKLCLIDVHQ